MSTPESTPEPTYPDDDRPLRTTVGVVAIERDVIRASGPDTITFLQGQLSQDIVALPVGGAAWSFLLQPQGKVEAWLRVVRVGDDEVVLDVDGGWGDTVITRLERFKLRTKCTFERLDWTCFAVRGPVSADAGAAAGEDDGVWVPLEWPAGVQGFDVFGAGLEPPAGIAVCPAEAYERLRIEAGVPAMGAELTDQTIPNEMGQWLIDASVSFTKGCYTGQELVARIDSRGGNVPRHLRQVVIDDDAPAGSNLAAAEVVDAEGKVVGRLTSVAPHSSVALALVQRAVEPPAAVEIRTADGQLIKAQVEPLPQPSASST